MYSVYSLLPNCWQNYNGETLFHGVRAHVGRPTGVRTTLTVRHGDAVVVCALLPNARVDETKV